MPDARRARGSAPLALALGAALALALAGRAQELASTSRLAPLADRSLLLDVTRAGERLVAVGERGHVLLSDDWGESWWQVVVPTRATLTAVDFADARHGWAVGHDAVVLHSPDAGETWIPQYEARELESPLLDVWFEDARRGIAVGAYRLFLETRDGGATWTQRSVSEQDAHLNAIVRTDDGRLYLAGEFGTLLRSDDDGESWSELESPYGASFFDALALGDGSLVVLGLRGNAFRSDDGGESWRALATGTQSSLMGGSVLPDGRVALGGLLGTLLVGAPDADPLVSRRRSDRRALSALLPRPDGRLVAVGVFGADVMDPDGAN